MKQDQLFAEFLGYKYFPYPDEMKCAGWRKDVGDKLIHEKISQRGEIGVRVFLARTTKDLRFNNDWNWLMAVVDKIRELGYQVTIDGIGCRITGKNPVVNRIFVEVHDSNMFNSTYEACSKFVSGYKV